MAASVAMVVTGIKEVGQCSSCLVLLYVCHHLSFQSKKNLEATMPLVMPFVQGILFGMCQVSLQETLVVCHPCFEGHTLVEIILERMAAAEDLLCQTTMMMMPLMMPFVQGILFSMHLVNLQVTQVVCG
jgi:hypothetical protein